MHRGVRSVAQRFPVAMDLFSAHVDAVLGKAGGPQAPTYTLAELKQYDGAPGKQDPTLLLAVLGRVFNVTTGAEFYAHRKPYHLFAGHDCTKNFALTKKRADWLNTDIADLEPKKLKHLNDSYWMTYVRKYPIVGVLADPPYDVEKYDVYAGVFAEVRVTEEQDHHVEEPDDSHSGEKKTKCPVMQATKAVTEFVVSLGQRLLLGAPSTSSEEAADDRPAGGDPDDPVPAGDNVGDADAGDRQEL